MMLDQMDQLQESLLQMLMDQFVYLEQDWILTDQPVLLLLLIDLSLLGHFSTLQ